MTKEIELSRIYQVENALDLYLTSVPLDSPVSIRSAELAELVSAPSRSMQAWLQEYRVVQGCGGSLLRYRIAAEGYGPAARWKLLRRPDGDSNWEAVARVEHALWIFEDGIRRLFTDYRMEVQPALCEKGELQLSILCEMLLTQGRSVAETAERLLADP